MPIEEYIMFVFVCVSEHIDKILFSRKAGFAPKLSDSEIITMEIVG